MKRILSILLCLLFLLSLASCGGEYPVQGGNPGDKESPIDTQNPGGDEIPPEDVTRESEMMVMTIAVSKEGYSAFIEEPERGFYAHNEDGALCRILWYWLDDLREGDTVYVEHMGEDTFKYMCYDLPPDAKGFYPTYEIEAKSVWSSRAMKLKDTALALVSEEFGVAPERMTGRYFFWNDTYEFTFTVSLGGLAGPQLTVNLSYSGNPKGFDARDKELLQFVDTEVEEAIPAAIARMDDKAGKKLGYYNLKVDAEGYLCIESEDIVNLSPDDPDYGKGCGDHRHDFYKERVGKLGE